MESDAVYERCNKIVPALARYFKGKDAVLITQKTIVHLSLRSRLGTYRQYNFKKIKLKFRDFAQNVQSNLF